MRVGTRITLTTTGLVILALVIYGVVSVRVRRAELRIDLERQTQLVGSGLQVSLEAALQEALVEDVRRLVKRFQEAEKPIGITYVELRMPPAEVAAPQQAAQVTGSDGGEARLIPDGGLDGGMAVAGSAAEGPEDNRPVEPYLAPTADAARDSRIRRVQIDGNPFGEHVLQGGRMVYFYTVPIRDEHDQVVAAIDLARDESEEELALAATQQNVAITVILLFAGLALLVFLTTQRSISQPIQRLVEGIDEVSHGDLTRVILREREDEIGDLADRFNQMTENLRAARAETERSVEARLTLEARLRHSEKLATIGQLAAQIAHEVGTPLGVIGGRARTMEKKAADPQEVAKNAGIIAAQAARITKIIQRLLDYARKKAIAREVVDVLAVVKDSADFLEHQLASSNVTLQIRPFVVEDEGGATTPEVLGSADELQQVALNLIMNAIQSMPAGGAIEVSARGILRRKPGLDLAPQQRYVALAVADEGVGIEPDARDRIFEPFYSTKQAEGGTGLGLAVSLGIVKDHDGWIEIDAAQPRGSIFRVFLPAPIEPEAKGGRDPEQPRRRDA